MVEKNTTFRKAFEVKKSLPKRKTDVFYEKMKKSSKLAKWKKPIVYALNSSKISHSSIYQLEMDSTKDNSGCSSLVFCQVWKR